MFHYQSKHVAKYATGLMNACWTLFQSSLQPYVNQFVYEAEEEIYENNTSLAAVVIEIAEVLALLLGIKRYRYACEVSLSYAWCRMSSTLLCQSSLKSSFMCAQASDEGCTASTSRCLHSLFASDGNRQATA
jgi:hypothetical protein